MEEKLIVDVDRLSPRGEVLEGEVSAVDIDEEFVKPFGGVRYRIEVRLCGTELLLKGSLEQDFDLVCSRCGRDFDDTVKVGDFLVSREITSGDGEVDLTELVRESIILALPTYPVCGETCPGVESAEEKPVDDRWSALDNLK